MKPLRIYIENFMSHSLTDIDCNAFESTLIVGRNRNNPNESNGVGKSTIFHAIDYVLFGKYPTKTIDKVVRDGRDLCKVKFEFEVNSDIYRVVRTRSLKSSKSDLRLYKKNKEEWVDISQKTPTETENELSNKIIKINYKTFHNSVVFAQSDLSGLASASPEARKGILKEILNLNNYIKFEKIAKKKTSDLVNKLTNIESLILNIGDPKSDIDDFNSKLKEIKEKTNSFIEERDGLQKSLSIYREKLFALQQKDDSNLPKLKANLKSLDEKICRVNSNISSLEANLSSKESKLQSLTKGLGVKVNQFNSLNEEFKALDLVELRDLDNVKEILKKSIKNEINGRAYIGSLEAKVEELRLPMPDEDSCPHCRQPLTEEHKNECLRQIAEEIQSLDSKIFENSNKLKVVTSKRESLEQEIKNIESINSKKNGIFNKIQATKDEIKNSQDYSQQLSELIVDLKSDLKNASVDKKAMMSERADIAALVNSTKGSEHSSEADKIQEIILEKENSLELSLREISSLNTYLGIYTEKISSRERDEKELKKLNKSKKALELDLKIHKHVCRAFSSRGIPTMIIYTILDDIQIETNNLLSQLRPGLEIRFVVAKDTAKGKEEDTLDIAYRINGIERDYEQLSGGQKLFISLSLKLALSLIIQKRLGVDIRFLELDEVDQPLDKAGVDAFADVIKSWQNNFKIFVITHNDALKDKFSNAILVEHDEEEGSRGRLVSSW
jgi:DNA repair exonuclease SbcCD ATPase subunit